ncbi:lipid kinase [Enterovirga rhinocerotis]|uniref:YegS/Rv2252/BmrU family lipid kinase n=1 Tax=Enterovirga rhinocerotis TaxID=1339210 RepID=A0A4R7C7M2_9HYPH|nr:lipid kinase [Enterovirga rhinocerotis]TDR94301.1 YegS/Rv2252/BmrU family lipid kinase [Enterovirga rhinocerotis]
MAGTEQADDPPEPRQRRALLVVNHAARGGAQPIDAATAILDEGGIAVETMSAQDIEDLGTILRDRADSIDLVIVGGGDGSLNRAAPALRDSGLPMGILPLGTGNDLARTLGIPLDIAAAARVIVAGETRVIDIGEVNGHLFFNVASIGFSAQLASELTADAKKRWGVIGYALAGARLLMRTHPFTAFIEHDNATDKVKTVQISVGNGRHYGGGMTVDPEAEPDDGVLHVYSLEVSHWARLLALVPALRRGTQGEAQDVRAFRTRAVTIRTRRARSVNTDGELTTATPASFRVVPKAVTVYVPSPIIL